MQIRGTGIRIGACSVSGRRPINEDGTLAVAHIARGGVPVVCAAVADGIGSSGTGSLASSTALRSIRGAANQATNLQLDLREIARHALLRANEDVRAALSGAAPGGGTTLAAVLLRGTDLVVAHVGDSRVYRIRGGSIEQLTLDHNLAAETGLGADGKPVPNPLGHALTRAIGQESPLEVDIGPAKDTLALTDGDIFVLCTDGVCGSVSSPILENDVILDTVLAADSVEAGADYLVRAAYAQGSTDNASAIILESGRHARQPGAAAPPPPLQAEATKAPAPVARPRRGMPHIPTYAVAAGALLLAGVLIVLALQLFSEQSLAPAAGSGGSVGGPHAAATQVVTISQLAHLWAPDMASTEIASVNPGNRAVVVLIRVRTNAGADVTGSLTVSGYQRISARRIADALTSAPGFGGDWTITFQAGQTREQFTLRN